ncbi:MAG: hypothetical protein ACLP50_33080 [Solirubrobacteraceae bacterium]
MHDVRVRVLVVEDHVELARDIAKGLRDRAIATDLAFQTVLGAGHRARRRPWA